MSIEFDINKTEFESDNDISEFVKNTHIFYKIIHLIVFYTGRSVLALTLLIYAAIHTYIYLGYQPANIASGITVAVICWIFFGAFWSSLLLILPLALYQLNSTSSIFFRIEDVKPITNLFDLNSVVELSNKHVELNSYRKMVVKNRSLLMGDLRIMKLFDEKIIAKNKIIRDEHERVMVLAKINEL